MGRGNVPDNFLDPRLLQMLDLPPGDFLIIIVPRDMLGLGRQPSQQGKVLGEHIGEAVE